MSILKRARAPFSIMISWADANVGCASRLMFHPRAYVVVWLNLSSPFSETRSRCFFFYIRTSSASRRFSLTRDTGGRGSIESSKIKKLAVSLYSGTWSGASASELSSEGYNIGQALPTEWSNYLLIGGSPVSRTITLANPLDGNFNRYNWNRKTGRNADCSSSSHVILCRTGIQKRAFQFASMYFKLQTAHAMLLNVNGKIGNWKIVKEHQIDNIKRFRVHS